MTLSVVLVAVHGGALSKNIIQLIVEDHDRARSLWQQYNMPGTTARQKSTIAWTMIRESSVHSAKEEEVCADRGSAVATSRYLMQSVCAAPCTWHRKCRKSLQL